MELGGDACVALGGVAIPGVSPGAFLAGAVGTLASPMVGFSWPLVWFVMALVWLPWPLVGLPFSPRFVVEPAEHSVQHDPPDLVTRTIRSWLARCLFR